MYKLLKKIVSSRWFKKYANTILLVLILFFSYGSFVKVAAQQGMAGHVYVQTVGGETVEAISQGDLHREPVVVSRFAEEFVLRSFHWGHGIEGIQEENNMFPKAFFSYSYGVDSSIRPVWMMSNLNKYHKTKYDFNKFSKGSINAIPEKIMEPIIKEISPGHWSAEIKALRHFWTKDGKPLNSEILHYELEIEAYRPVTTYLWGKPETIMGQALNKFQLTGLKVVKYVDLAKGIA